MKKGIALIMSNPKIYIKNINLIMIILFLLSTHLFANSKLSDVMDSANEKKIENKKVYTNKTSNTRLLCGILDIMSADDDTDTKKDNEETEEDENSENSKNLQFEKTVKDSWLGFKIGEGRIYSNKYGRYKYVDIFLGDYSKEKSLTQGVIGVGTINLADDGPMPT